MDDLWCALRFGIHTHRRENIALWPGIGLRYKIWIAIFADPEKPDRDILVCVM
jgi:hypothetical protein